MKTLKLTLGFIFTIYLTSFSQITYDSIVTESKIWSTLSGGFGVEMVECCYQTSFVKFEIDPLINTIDEKQVLISTDSLKTWTKVGNIKESDKKIYFRDAENKQGLIYDFGATEGSIIYLVNYYNDSYEDTIQVRIDKIDTINYQGIDRRRFEVIYNSGRIDYWIEGIGSTKGILNSCLILDGGFRELLCVHENNSLIYQNEERKTCYMDDNLTGIDKYADKDFKVYPNPSKGSIIIDYSGEINNLSYSICNSIGQIIDSDYINNKEFRVNLETGLYILRIKDKNKLIFEDKLLITK